MVVQTRLFCSVIGHNNNAEMELFLCLWYQIEHYHEGGCFYFDMRRVYSACGTKKEYSTV